ncbi:MAG: ATP synthase subunit I [Gammaproteobacteria bacterium]
MTEPLVDARPLIKASALHLCAWLLFAALTLVVDPLAAKSVVFGAAIAILPGAFMAWAVFRFRKTVAPRDFTRAVYRGELGKFLSTIVLFALVFAEGGAIRVAVLFGVFLVAMVVQWALAARHLLQD